jgi:hypothetical protein
MNTSQFTRSARLGLAHQRRKDAKETPRRATEKPRGIENRESLPFPAIDFHLYRLVSFAFPLRLCAFAVKG